MPKKDLVRKKQVERHSWDVKSRSNMPQVKHASGNRRKLRSRKKIVENNATAEQQQCIICMDTTMFQNREKILCGHTFHKKCINRWLQDAGTCPICRKSVKQPPDEHQTFVGQQPRLIPEQQTQQYRQISHGQQELHLQSQQRLRQQEQRLRQRQQQIREQRQLNMQLSRGLQRQARQQLQRIPTAPGRMGRSLQTSSAVQARLDGLQQNLQLPTAPGRLVLRLETSSNMQLDCRPS